MSKTKNKEQREKAAKAATEKTGNENVEVDINVDLDVEETNPPVPNDEVKAAFGEEVTAKDLASYFKIDQKTVRRQLRKFNAESGGSLHSFGARWIFKRDSSIFMEIFNYLSNPSTFSVIIEDE